MSSNSMTQNSNPSPSPLSGTFIEGVHHLPLHIYYENTDMGGIVYHAEYLKFMERARTEFIRYLGFHQSDLIKDDIIFVVFHLSIDYKKPALMDDEIVVKTQLIGTKSTYMTFSQRIEKGPHLLTKATVKVCCINKAGKPRGIPEKIKAAVRKN